MNAPRNQDGQVNTAKSFIAAINVIGAAATTARALAGTSVSTGHAPGNRGKRVDDIADLVFHSQPQWQSQQPT